MALHAVNPEHGEPKDERRREDSPVIETCPVCDGSMELVYSRNAQQVIVCKDCHSGLTVPAAAWNIVRIKREAKWMPKP
jgi:ssDNA-binding Zn-finger/Zn-ribbon topoisomerase 1